MNKSIKFLSLILCLIIITSVSGCTKYEFGEEGNYIVSAKEALEQIKNGAILVDVQSFDNYKNSHIEGAINIPMSSLVVNEPYDNMLPSKDIVETVMSEAGIKETDLLLLYDNNDNMQAARVQWTLEIYGNKNTKVVSGGIKALQDKGANTSTEIVTLSPSTYKTSEKDNTLIVNLDYINALMNNPNENVIIVDTRSAEEFSQGTIPTSKFIEYKINNYATGEYKSPRDIKLTYLDEGIKPENRIIVFCKTSVRAAQTYSALKNAGFMDVRVYDGAWLEYSANNAPSVQQSDTNIVPSAGDGS